MHVCSSRFGNHVHERGQPPHPLVAREKMTDEIHASRGTKTTKDLAIYSYTYLALSREVCPGRDVVYEYVANEK